MKRQRTSSGMAGALTASALARAAFTEIALGFGVVCHAVEGLGKYTRHRPRIHDDGCRRRRDASDSQNWIADNVGWRESTGW